MNDLIQADQYDDKISNSLTQYTPEQVAVIKNTVAKNTTNLELAFFLNVAQSVGLNPFNKEIWCYKDNKKNLLVFAGRDGFLVKAQRNPAFAGIRSAEIRENDEFSIDVANKKIVHNVTKWGDERGPIKGSYAIVFRKDGEPTIETSDFARYNKGYNTWKTHPEDMIKKVSETKALKKAFGVAGVQSEYDFEIKNQVAIPLEQTAKFSLIDDIKDLREGVDGGLTDQDWLKKVCTEMIGKSKPATPGEKEHIRKEIFQKKTFDLKTGASREEY